MSAILVPQLLRVAWIAAVIGAALLAACSKGPVPVESVTLGSFQCRHSLAPGKTESLSCNAEGRELFAVMQAPAPHGMARTIGIGNGEVRLEDWDGDGVWNSLSYDVLDKSGTLVAESQDLNFDGRAEIYTDARARRLYRRLDNAWVEVRPEGHDASGKVIYCVTLNGKARRVFPFLEPPRFEALPNTGGNGAAGNGAPARQCG